MKRRIKASLITFTFGLCTFLSVGAEGLGIQLSLPAPAITIPIVIVHGIPVVQLTVNGISNQLFLLDSGSQRTMLNLDVATQMKISRIDKSGMTLMGTGDSIGYPAAAVRSVKIKFKKELLLRGDFPAASLSAYGDTLGIKLAGIIGYDLLRSHPSVIDFTNRRLMIYPTNEFVNVRGNLPQAFNVDKDGLYPVISGVVGVGQTKCGIARVLLDTGSDRTGLINAHFASKYRLTELTDWRTAKIRGFNGDAEILHGLPGWVDLGSKLIQIPDIAVTLASQGIATSDPYDLYLGAPVLNHGIVIFDVGDGYVSFGDLNEAAQP